MQSLSVSFPVTKPVQLSSAALHVEPLLQMVLRPPGPNAVLQLVTQ